MKILNANQIKEWDNATLAEQNIDSLQLMQRAAEKLHLKIVNRFGYDFDYHIFCGIGNNGGDGLALALLMLKAGINCKIYCYAGKRSAENDTYLATLKENYPKHLHFDCLKPIDSKNNKQIIIDALFGNGLSRPLEGIWLDLVKEINKQDLTVVSIDLPSGLPADRETLFFGSDWYAVQASITLSIQSQKEIFFIEPYAKQCGAIGLIDINLSPKYINDISSNINLINNTLCSTLLKIRERFTHKGSYGHAGFWGGHAGKNGAIMLAAKAALQSGCGLVSFLANSDQIDIFQLGVPDAMCRTIESSFDNKYLTGLTAIGIGPGFDESYPAEQFSTELQSIRIPLVLDAGALNILAKLDPVQFVPKAVITPHPKEFDRLFGAHTNHSERITKQVSESVKQNIYIVLKGVHTTISTPTGKIYYNSSGNASLAKGGSGDVLLGMITSFCACGYEVENSCILAVFLHGLAADLWLNENKTMNSLTASELIEYIYLAIAKVEHN
jgi:NAD(P)H-hydrate epimerase